MIFHICGVRGILDSDLARIYGETTTRLNQQVRRNADRFPGDFMFQLTKEEFELLILQNATSKKGRGGRRELPLVFTEHGAIMAANVLNSKRAVQMPACGRQERVRRSGVHQDAQYVYRQQRACTKALGTGARTEEPSRRTRNSNRRHSPKNHVPYRPAGAARA
ncbi:MAG: ORF6N domain-containing protein, partial [Bacteroidota bacterium]